MTTPGPEKTNDPTSAYGKYDSLEKQIFAPLDFLRYGSFYDKGYSAVREYGGEKNLPPGYWVYYPPSWYIWEREHDTHR